MSNNNESIAPWYKQPWLWFILTPLIAVFIMGMVNLTLSIVTKDGLVKEDHYKVARGYVKDSSKIDAAKTQGLNGELTVDNLTGDLVLQLAGKPTNRHETLLLELVHPIHQKYDQVITMKAIAGSQIYRGNLPAAMKGKRYVILQPEDQSWQIRSEITPPYDQNKFKLSPEGN